MIGLKTYPLPPDKPVEFKHSLKPGRYLADFSLVRVGIAESVPPPRLVIGFGKDRRHASRPSGCRTRRSSIATGSRSPRGTTWSTSRLRPARPKVPMSPSPQEVAANVSGDKRYGDDVGLHVDSMVVRGPVPLNAGIASRVASEDPLLHARLRRSVAASIVPAG